MHSHIQGNITFLLKANYRTQYSTFPELSIDFPDGKWGVPDISIYPKMEINIHHDEIRMSEPPLCAIEILSLGQSLQDILDRKPKYFDMGVKSVWIIIPVYKTIYVHSSDDDYETFANEDVLKDEQLGIELSLKEVFS